MRITTRALLVITSILLCSFIYLLIYFFAFHGAISDIQSDFSSFGSYLGGLGSIASVATLTYLIYERKQIYEEKIRNERRTQIRYAIDNFRLSESQTNDSSSVFISIFASDQRLGYLYELIHSSGFDEIEKNNYRYVILSKLTTDERNNIRRHYKKGEPFYWFIEDELPEFTC